LPFFTVTLHSTAVRVSCTVTVIKEEGRDDALASLDDVDHRITILGEAVHESVQRIEKIFAQATVIETSDAVKLRAAERAVDKSAPFHKDKNSIGDAILIEVYRDILSGSVCSHYGHRWQCKLDTPCSINWTRWATRTGRLYSLWIEKVGVHAHLLDLVFLINAPLSQAH
jgi:hypothetical protein